MAPPPHRAAPPQRVEQVAGGLPTQRSRAVRGRASCQQPRVGPSGGLCRHRGCESRAFLQKQEEREVLPRRSASKARTWSSALSSDLGYKEDHDRQGARATPPRTSSLKRPQGHSSSNSKNQALHRMAILLYRRGNRGSAECHPLRTAHRYHRTPALLSP